MRLAWEFKSHVYGNDKNRCSAACLDWSMNMDDSVQNEGLGKIVFQKPSPPDMSWYDSVEVGRQIESIIRNYYKSKNGKDE